MTTTINAPDGRANGTSWFGPIELDFKDGVATYDGELGEGLTQYLLAHGFGIDAPAAEPDEVEHVDSRDYDEPQIVGTPLRDAAVDPQPEDFLAPVNAGQGDPHGPEVVAPGIHAASMPKPIHPGPVGASGNTDTPDTADDPQVVTDTDAQDTNETNLAEAVLVEQQPVQDATQAAAKVDPVNTDQIAVRAGDYDPADYTVDEVNAYLDGKDDAERERVLSAERDGKARKGIVGD